MTTRLKLQAYRQSIETALNTKYVEIRVGREAITHMRHYLDNTGSDLQLDLAGLMQRSSTVQREFASELQEAREFCESLPPGKHPINSTRAASGYFNDVATERGLQYGIGGHLFWGSGTVEIIASSGNARTHSLEFEFHFFDRYNWDSGKSFRIPGFGQIDDEFMQQFHKHCLAREFDIKGLLGKSEVWQASWHKQPELTGNPFSSLNLK